MDSSVLSDVLKNLQSLCGANGAIFGYAQDLLISLMTIDFAVVFIMQVFGFANSNYIPTVFSKLMKYGFWVWVVNNWDMLINALLSSLTTAGASFGSLDAGIVGRPSEIIDYGFQYARQYYEVINSTPFAIGTLGKSAFLWIMAIIAMIGVFAAFAYIALNAFITFIEFYIISALMLLFIPFAVNDKTSRFSENAIGFIIGTGVKLMMMGAILSLTMNQTEVLGESLVGSNGTITWESAFSAVVLAWVFAFLAVHVPELASGAMSGSPSLSGNTATASMAGAMSGGIAGAVASKAMGAASGGSNAVAKAAGALSEGGGGNFSAAGGSLMAAGKAAMSGDKSGAFANLGVAAQSFGQGAAGFAKGGLNLATSGMQDSYDKGQGASQAKFGQYHPTSPGTGSMQEKLRSSKESQDIAAKASQMT